MFLPTSFRSKIFPVAFAEEPQEAPINENNDSILTPENIQAEITPEDSQSTSTPEIIPEDIDAFLEVSFALDNVNWQKLGKVSRDTWRRAEFEIPIINWEDLSKIQISIQNLTTFDEQPAVYLDGMWLEVEYRESVEEELSPEEIAKLPRVRIDDEKIFKLLKKDFRADEEPEFDIDVSALIGAALISAAEKPAEPEEPIVEETPVEEEPPAEELKPKSEPEPEPESEPLPEPESKPAELENNIINFLKKFIPTVFAKTSKAKIIKTEVFNLLRNDIQWQIKILEEARARRQLTEEEEKIIGRLKQSLDEIEKFVRKEIEDIIREVK